MSKYFIQYPIISIWEKIVIGLGIAKHTLASQQSARHKQLFAIDGDLVCELRHRNGRNSWDAIGRNSHQMVQHIDQGRWRQNPLAAMTIHQMYNEDCLFFLGLKLMKLELYKSSISY